MNNFELALQKTIKSQVDSLLKEEDPNQNKLLPPAARYQKLEEELKKSLNLAELQENVSLALKIFRSEGMNYLSGEEFGSLQENLNILQRQLENFDFANFDIDLESALEISPSVKASMLKIGIAKFEENSLLDALSVFNFLVSLDNDDPNYWYRLGLVAQELGRYDFALSAFLTTLQLTPDFIGARIFKAQCYFSNNQSDLALNELNEIKNQTNGNNENWKEYIIHLENLIGKRQ